MAHPVVHRLEILPSRFEDHFSRLKVWYVPGDCRSFHQDGNCLFLFRMHQKWVKWTHSGDLIPLLFLLVMTQTRVEWDSFQVSFHPLLMRFEGK